MADSMLDTASQRPPTGMEVAARQLIFNALEGCSNQFVLHGFLEDNYPSFEDYIRAVREVWGDAPADRMHNSAAQAASEPSMVVSAASINRRQENVAEAFLVHMPEPDFRLVVFDAFSNSQFDFNPVARITTNCKKTWYPVGVHGG
jgi:hypothetical protein